MTEMKADAIRKITEQVLKKHPKLAGKLPKITEQSPGNYLLVYRFSDELPGGKSISQTVRVVANEQGKISKISSSRG
ncbi:MAG: hypothetical protein GX603_03175 [Chloroflexi bacterium]|nr:hypothetical protein [Chloroflexota bacterium]